MRSGENMQPKYNSIADKSRDVAEVSQTIFNSVRAKVSSWSTVKV